MNFEAQNLWTQNRSNVWVAVAHLKHLSSFSPNKIMNLEPLKSIDSKAQKSRILKDVIAFTLKKRGPKPQKHVSLKPSTSMKLKSQNVMNRGPHETSRNYVP